MKIEEFIDSENLEDLNELTTKAGLTIRPFSKKKLKEIVNEKDFIYNFLSQEEIKDLILLYFGERISPLPAKFSLLLINNEQGIIFFEETKQFIKDFIKKNIIGKNNISVSTEKKTSDYLEILDKFSNLLKSKPYKYQLNKVPIMLIKDAKNILQIDEDVVKFLYSFFLENNFITINNLSYINIDTNNFLNDFLSKDSNYIYLSLFSFFTDRYIFNIAKGANVATRAVQYILRTYHTIDIEKLFLFFKELFSNENTIKNIITLAIKLNFFIQEDNFLIKTQFSGDIQVEKDTFLYVQPNYEIITNFLTSLDKRLFISEFAELEKHDTAIIYKITKKSILNAISKNISKQHIIEFLKKESINPVPQNVLFSINEWAKEYGALSIRKTEIIEAKDTLWIEKILAIEEIKPYIIKRLSPTVIEVKNSEEIFEILSQKEFYVDYKQNNQTSEKTEDKKIKDTSKQEKPIHETMPFYLKKYFTSNRMISLNPKDLLKVINYVFAKDIKIEFFYENPDDTLLHNKKIIAKILEINENWENPEIIAYLEDLKLSYKIPLKYIKKIRPILS